MKDLTWNDLEQLEVNKKADVFFQRFKDAPTTSRFVMGTNSYADFIGHHYSFHAYIDDFTSDSTRNGLPIIRSSDIPKDSVTVLATILHPLSASKKMMDLDLDHLDYFSFLKVSNLNGCDLPFLEDFTNEYNTNKEHYRKIYGLLADSKSKQIFLKLISFRLTGNLKYLEGFSDRESQQYFEDFLNLNPAGETFVDIGGFDGYTSLQFSQSCPNYSGIYFFEPNFQNMQRANSNLKDLDNLRFFDCGLGSQNGEAKISNFGSSSRVSDSDGQIIKIRKLDQINLKNPSFVKMDIEGSEIDAILGASNTIKMHKPKLAICIYHQVGDYWKIPFEILKIHEDYKLYVRHYSESLTETVMFFIPEEN